MILLSAIAGALILGGAIYRSQSNQAYWREMNRLANIGGQSEERPRLDAGLSTARMNANIAIGVGVLILLALFLG